MLLYDDIFRDNNPTKESQLGPTSSSYVPLMQEQTPITANTIMSEDLSSPYMRIRFSLPKQAQDIDFKADAYDTGSEPYHASAQIVDWRNINKGSMRDFNRNQNSELMRPIQESQMRANPYNNQPTNSHAEPINMVHPKETVAIPVILIHNVMPNNELERAGVSPKTNIRSMSVKDIALFKEIEASEPKQNDTSNTVIVNSTPL